MLTYEGFPGEHISTACEEAKEIAKKNRKPIRFDFNGVKIVATGKKSISSMLWEFDLVLGQHSQTYRRSRKYQEYKKKRDREVRQSQFMVDSLTNGLPGLIEEGLVGVVYFCAALSKYADNVDVKTDFNRIVSVLEGAGYINNEHTGRPESDFSNAETMGRYIVGQAINCMKKGLPPHPITTEFEKTYKKARQ